MTEAPQRRTDRRRAWKEARRIVWQRRGRLALGLLLVAAGRLAGLALPASSKLLIDEVLGAGRRELLLPIAAAIGGATAVEAAASFALAMLLGVAAQRSITELRRELAAHVLRLPARAFEETRSGELAARILSDAEGIRNLVGSGLVQLVGGLVTAAAALAVLLWIDWRLTAAVLALLAGFGVAVVAAFRWLRPLFRERSRLWGEISGRLSETIGGIRVVKAYTAERHEERLFARGVHRLFRNVARTMVGISALGSLSSLLVGAVGVLLVWQGGGAVLGGRMTLGDLVMYVFFTGLLAAPLVQVGAVATQLSEALAGLDRMRELLAQVPESARELGRAPVLGIAGAVEFDRVSFSYREGEPVLREVSFVAPAGTTTALVGPSGSGKSTLIRLVMAFDPPTAGRVLVDGRDLAGLRLADYRRQLGAVLQESFLFDGTVAENIAYGDRHADRAAIERAGRLAHCDEFVATFEKGYDTVVGERGVKLSGGQKQRVAIARAVLAEPAILLLDEATSSLDSESEALIQDGLARLREGRTTFVIAHRLSTIRSADQILVLDQGRIAERGTHAELMRLGGRYRQLHDRQYHLEGDRFLNPGEEKAVAAAHAGQADPARA
ncbi:MAG: ABC transporter ATP-binding protein/permease [Thermoanaerobaculia bacterium]|nr:ABC transporter ATP-binding protein/permease [Thermoanaerobaculia bacterium]